MKKGLLDFRIPNFAAFLLLLVSIGVTVFLIKDRLTITGRASQDTMPENIVISNITSESFTVSFTTQRATQGGISLEETTELDTLFRDAQETNDHKEFQTHFITVNNLKPQTSYAFSIISGGNTYVDNGQAFRVKTGEALQEKSQNTVTASGQIIRPDGEPAAGAVVHIQADNSQALSVLTNSDGKFTLPLDTLRTSLLSGYQSLSPSDVLTLEVRYENLASTARVLYEHSGQIPPITLTENYNFTNTPDTLDSTPQAGLLIPSGAQASTTVAITNPQNNASLMDNRPVIRGTAGPNKLVDISISPDNLKAQVTAATSGNWSFRPPTPLSQGKHTLTVRSSDATGVSKTLTQSFSIFPSGSRIQQSATLSATPRVTITSSPTPTRILTATPTIPVTLAPTLPTTPSATMSPSPTLSPTPTLTFTPSPTIPVKVIPTVAPPGGTASFVLTGVSLFFIVTGAVLFFIIS